MPAVMWHLPCYDVMPRKENRASGLKSQIIGKSRCSTMLDGGAFRRECHAAGFQSHHCGERTMLPRQQVKINCTLFPTRALVLAPLCRPFRCPRRHSNAFAVTPKPSKLAF